ncbi:MAG TPA: hypothetical protein VLC28_04435 [Flavitalea sp.]|nr:hypothetical protein [Flavitalea sp.]
MRPLLLVLLITIVCVSCSKTQESETPQGSYVGTFQRITGGMGDTVHVSLALVGNVFSGLGGRDYYPSICNGTFAFRGEEMDFHNACSFTANFDWSLILSGKYTFEAKADSLIITRNYNGIFRDEYRLAKVTH